MAHVRSAKWGSSPFFTLCDTHDDNADSMTADRRATSRCSSTPLQEHHSHTPTTQEHDGRTVRVERATHCPPLVSRLADLA